MKLIRLALFAAAALCGTQAGAERLVFDHRLSPPLEAAFESKDPGRIAYNAKNPRYITDLVAVRGASAAAWIEALVIVARTPDTAVHAAGDWVAELKAEAAKRCPAAFETIAQDAGSITLERRSSDCPPDYPPVALYRVVAGRKSLFLLAAMARDGMTDESRRQWRAVLASARIE